MAEGAEPYDAALQEDYRILCESLKKVPECVSKIATDHREQHSTVSKVGKAIDRVTNSILWCFYNFFIICFDHLSLINELYFGVAFFYRILRQILDL